MSPTVRSCRPKTSTAVGSCFEVEHKIDEMFRVVEVQFQARDGASDSNQSLVVLAGGLKQLRDGDNFNKPLVFNGLHNKWGWGMAGDQLS